MSDDIYKDLRGTHRWRRLFNQICSGLALHAPGFSMRIFLNRLKGAKIGKDCWIGDHVTIDVHYGHPDWERSIVIGDRVAIGPNVKLFSHDTSSCQITRGRKAVKWGRIVIGDDSWIGPGAVVANCTIGKSCIIAPNSLVNRDVPDYSLVIGNPARVIKSLKDLVLDGAEAV